MSISLRTKLILRFSAVIAICGIVATYVGIHLIGDRIIRQAQDKVRVDLNSAREIYQERLNTIKDVVRMTATRTIIKQGIVDGDIDLMKTELKKIGEQESLDILSVVDDKGRAIFKTHNLLSYDDEQTDNEVLKLALSEKTVVASTEIMFRHDLMKEGIELAERAYFKFIPTPKAKPRPEGEETSGMVMIAAAPVLDSHGTLLGVLYGGMLLNRHYEIVDKIKNTVYQGEVYKGKDMGTATIFQGDLRISTNVQREDGSRAIGTRVSEEVYDQVLIKGLPWIERAFVVNKWYITAYEPIRNIVGDIIGILYVGMLEEKFTDMRRSTMLVFLGITFAGIAAALIISYFLANGILKPIRHLVVASEMLTHGDLTHRVIVESEDEIGELAKAFNSMAESLKDRDGQLKERAQQTIQETERLATIGQLAAGVAHELNNPLGGVLIYSHLLLENLPDDDPNRENLNKIVTQTTRCKKIVKGLLDFSRQSEPKIELTDGNKLLKGALSLLENQLSLQNIKIVKNLSDSPLHVMVDGSQIQQVFINIILNAAEAMEGEGKLHIKTRVLDDEQFMEITFKDTGCGISKENLKRLFEPFFTTKEVGHGTGLGLAISYGIIQRHNGNISVKSQVGKGTTFIIRLPIAKGEK
jgi:two-component system NtrC family sensor kinase